MDRTRILSLYRAILAAGRAFPSVKRGAVVEEIRAEFRAGAKEADAAKVADRLRSAVRGLDQLQAYSGLKRTANDWEISLKGPLD